MRPSHAWAGIGLVALVIVGMATATHGAVPSLDTRPIAAKQADAELGVSASPNAITIALLGDSYTAGNGARDGNGQSSYYGPGKCMRSTDTWGEQYARALADQGHAVTLINRACSAATTHDMLNERYLKRTEVAQFPQVEPVDARREDAFYVDWASAQPGCVPAANSESYVVPSVERLPVADGGNQVLVNCEHWVGAQVDALNPDVDLVFFTVGGNDAKFPDVMRTCLVLPSLTECEQALDSGEKFQQTEFADRLGAVLDEIHSRTNGNATVVYLGYPRIEASNDTVLSEIVNGQLRQLRVGERLDSLLAAGKEAQWKAVNAANERYGDGFVVFVDDLDELFAGHEPDASPITMNANRWIAEAFESTVIDEWYHFLPAGHAAIAEHVSQYGTFGVGGRQVARDVAVVTDGSDKSVAALTNIPSDLLKGASITLVEQELRKGQLYARVIARGIGPEELGEWGSAAADSSPDGWLPTAQLELPARWNANQHILYVGDASSGVDHLATLWTGSAQGRHVAPIINVVDTADFASPGIGAYVWAPEQTRAAVIDALRDIDRTPHAWGGNHYVSRSGAAVTLDARGSFAAVHSRELTYAWDLDGDGEFEHATVSPVLAVPATAVSTAWIALKVSDGAAYQALTYVYVSVESWQPQEPRGTTSVRMEPDAESADLSEPALGTLLDDLELMVLDRHQQVGKAKTHSRARSALRQGARFVVLRNSLRVMLDQIGPEVLATR